MVGIVDKDYLNIDECVGRKVRLVELRNKGKNLSVELDSIFWVGSLVKGRCCNLQRLSCLWIAKDVFCLYAGAFVSVV